jgi:3-oxoacyl-[acyl-carrier protein] reductase
VVSAASSESTPCRHRALVIGASRGIGAAVARRLAADGLAVTAVARDGAALGDVVGGLDGTEHHAVVADLATHAGRADLVAQLADAPCHVVVLTLRVRRPWARLEATSGEDLVQSFAENTEYLPTVLSACLPGQRAAGFGRWIAISSAMAELGGAGQAAYVAQKGALEALMRTVAVEEGRHGITANVVAPGFIRTDGTEQTYDPAIFDALARSNALGRPGTPDEVAHVVAMLAHPSGGFVTGATIPVSGGVQLGWSIDAAVRHAARSRREVDEHAG